MKEWHDVLSKVDVFFGLSQKERETLLSKAQEQEVKRKQLLFSRNTPATSLYVITNGALKTIQDVNEDKRLLVDFLKPGDVLGEDGVLLAGEYETDAAPFDNSTVLAIPAAEVRKVMDSQPRLGKALAAMSAAKARSYRERLFAMTACPVPVRLAQTLHMLARAFGKKEKRGTMIALRVTHQDLADYIGASRETVSLFISRFRKEGLITMNVRRIIVPDFKALKRVGK